jgi:hypothetical protein
MPWGLRIDANHAANANLPAGVYQPTFLYELLWDVGTAGLVLWADRRFKMGHGRAFLLYVMIYVAGRSWIEYLRVDHANHILGLRLNDWTSILVFTFALVAFLVSAKRSPGRETVVELKDIEADDAGALPADGATHASTGSADVADVADRGDRADQALVLSDERPSSERAPTEGAAP